MANPHRGEVGFQYGGRDYKLRFSTNALCELEDLLGVGVNAISQQLGGVDTLRMKTVRAVFWAGLLDNHPQITILQAGEMLGELGLTTGLKLVGDAFALAFPDPEETSSVPPLKPALGDLRASAGTGTTYSANGESSNTTMKNSGGLPRETSYKDSLPPK